MTTLEGGAISLAGEGEVSAVELHRFHGLKRDADGGADVLLPGGKYNLTDVSARIGIAQLAKLDGFNARRRELVARYYERLRTDPPLELPASGDRGHSWHMFAPLLPLERLRVGRGDFIRGMHARGIGVGVHYPALHLFTAYRKLGWREGQFPQAEDIGRRTVTLPLFPAMSLEDVDRVCGAAAEVLAEGRR
jgi:dTDP-4-amino-4,6-dideoxygalactose transaminase